MKKFSRPGAPVRESENISKNEAKELLVNALREGILSFDSSARRLSLTEHGVRTLRGKYGRVFNTPVLSAIEAVNEAMKGAPPIFRLSEGKEIEDFESLLEAIDLGPDVPEGMKRSPKGGYTYPDKIKWAQTYKSPNKGNLGDPSCPPIQPGVSDEDYNNDCRYKRDKADKNACVKVCEPE